MPTKRVLIYDITCPLPYDNLTLHSRPQGGTESTVTRIAEELAANNIVIVAQHNRYTPHQSSTGCVYTRIEPKLFKNKFDTIIVLRDTTPLRVLRPLYPDVNIYLWCHDLAESWLTDNIKGILDTKTELVCVSDFHKTNLTEAIKAKSDIIPRIHRVYNPIDKNITQKECKIDKNKLVFLSSPHKGLDYTIYLFERALTINPDFKLYVFNPGYVPSNYRTHPSIVWMKPTPSLDAVNFARDALCVFYPNTVFPETFGLVFAEANAVGTPVLAHRMGAAVEVLGGPPQVVDCKNMITALDTLVRWHEGDRPTVKANPAFSLAAILPEWVKLISV